MGGNRNKGNNKRQPSPTASRDTKASEKGQQSKKDTSRSEESSAKYFVKQTTTQTETSSTN